MQKGRVGISKLQEHIIAVLSQQTVPITMRGLARHLPPKYRWDEGKPSSSLTHSIAGLKRRELLVVHPRRGGRGPYYSLKPYTPGVKEFAL